MFTLTKPTTAKSETELVSFRAPRELVKKFEKECERTGISVSEGMRQLIQQLVESSNRGESK